ncbi:hypothetical protein B0H17DRAFT_1148146 [Mycena rosella]|nr:hypothetical protein B0H17DRAFT_1148146 [Mycena rosella]
MEIFASGVQLARIFWNEQQRDRGIKTEGTGGGGSDSGGKGSSSGDEDGKRQAKEQPRVPRRMAHVVEFFPRQGLDKAPFFWKIVKDRGMLPPLSALRRSQTAIIRAGTGWTVGGRRTRTRSAGISTERRVAERWISFRYSVLDCSSASVNYWPRPCLISVSEFTFYAGVQLWRNETRSGIIVFIQDAGIPGSTPGWVIVEVIGFLSLRSASF